MDVFFFNLSYKVKITAHPDGSTSSPCKQVSAHPELVEGYEHKLVEGFL